MKRIFLLVTVLCVNHSVLAQAIYKAEAQAVTPSAYPQAFPYQYQQQYPPYYQPYSYPPYYQPYPPYPPPYQGGATGYYPPNPYGGNQFLPPNPPSPYYVAPSGEEYLRQAQQRDAATYYEMLLRHNMRKRAIEREKSERSPREF